MSEEWPTGPSPFDGPWERKSKMPSFNSPTIEVIVGSDGNEKSFYIHQSLLSVHSEFFAAALKRPWKESRERLVKLPEEDPECFELFFGFVYTGQIFSWCEEDFKQVTPTRSSDEEWDTLAHGWNLGQKLLSSSFKDAISDAFAAKLTTSGYIPDHFDALALAKSTPSCGFRKLLVDLTAHTLSSENLSTVEPEERSHEFWFAVTQELCQMLVDGTDPESSPWETRSCMYHDHVAEKKPCYRSMFGK